MPKQARKSPIPIESFPRRGEDIEVYRKTAGRPHSVVALEQHVDLCIRICQGCFGWFTAAEEYPILEGYAERNRMSRNTRTAACALLWRLCEFQPGQGENSMLGGRTVGSITCPVEIQRSLQYIILQAFRGFPIGAHDFFRIP
jgi:hypothetical protein